MSAPHPSDAFDNLIIATPSAYAYPLLIKQLLLNSQSVSAGQEICYRGELRYTFADLRARIGKLASALEALGVGHGATVAVLDWDSHRYLESYFAIPMMGATLFTVNVRTSPQQIAYALNDSRAEVVLAHVDFLPVLEQIQAELKFVRQVVVLADGNPLPSTTLPFVGEYEALLAPASADFVFPEFDENTRAALFYTTGTTGDPKGVCYSHRQIVLHALTIATSFCSPRDGQRLHREDVYMPITPMFHVLAWGVPYIAVLLGLRIVLPGRYVPERLLALQKSEKVTFSHCVPTILQMLLDAARREGQKLDGWKIVIGGSALPPGLCRAAVEQGIDVFAGYGMSETGPTVALSQFPPGGTPADQDENIRKRAMTGRPLPMVDLRVVDDDMRDVPRDGVTPGEVVLRAPFLTLGYHNQPEASEALWRGGYLHTQDVAVMTPDGYIQIVDRIKDVIKTGGEWVSSIEIEGLIGELPDVQECAVVGVKDDKWGERPMALVVLVEGSALGADEVRQHLLRHAEANRISRYAVPEANRIAFVAEIPKTSVGKIDKKAIRHLIG
ncbi:Long-chain-fatty-acid--CoA ligase [Paraburkholderia caffeinitolerans]|uniref:Long-chain-fatty-acid--CoA ligase n=1 Tax=Paraburkholderia caffeinitolerans TaxID=1723730 RepID=A0A6J5GAZ7_9BURK|nr:fatty acid--CoA ligase [Paraburkholderia caffeinitolerans]CAB3793224.1 Long-chain-fatty-acid--CoA ligase [Paraburkholderia caffeinitolerans]